MADTVEATSRRETPGSDERSTRYSRAAAFWRKFRKHKLAFAAAIFVVVLILAALVGPLVTPYGYTTPDYSATLSGSTTSHLLGTDHYGRDILSRIVAGTRISLFISVAAVAAGAIAGIILGLISGFYGSWLDTLIMRACDVLFAFPGMLLAIGIVAILGTSLFNVIIAIAIFSAPQFARIVRSTTLEVKNTVRIDATRAIGASRVRILVRHIMPGALSTVIVYFSMRIGSAIIITASLSFLGLGAQPPSPEWGAMLSDGRDYLATAPHVTIYPGLAIFVTVLALNLFGDGLRDTLDPKIKE